jgi:purine catabolism regulator
MASLRSIVDVVRAGDMNRAVLLDGPEDKEVSEVRLIEDVAQLEEAGPGSLVVFDRHLSPIAGTYRMDIAVRRAISRPIAGLMVILPPSASVSMTARALCRKSELSLVRLAPESDLTGLLHAMARQVADELHLTVDLARRACEAIGRLDTGQMTVPELISEGGRMLGRDVSLGPRPAPDDPSLLAVPAVVTAPDGDWLITARLNDADADSLLEMVLWRLAVEASRCALGQERVRAASRHSIGEVLLQLVEADRAGRTELANGARRLGIPIDGWHVVTRIELENLRDIAADDVLAFERRDELARLALEAATEGPGTWHVAQDPSTLLLLWSESTPPSRDTGVRIQRQIRHVLQILVQAAPALRTYCGIGTPRAGVAGLAASATESQLAAASARARRRINQPMSFDAVGMRTTLVEWYGSPTVQKSIDALFAPLADMSDFKRNAILDTLCVYLDAQGSISRSAEALHLHRNAVRYRVQRAFAVLDIDEDDADQRLFLHLACRARRPASSSRPRAAAAVAAGRQ